MPSTGADAGGQGGAQGCSARAAGHGTRTVTLRRQSGYEVSWCGLLLDVRTLQVRRDYSRYEHASLRDAVTIGFDGAPGLKLRDRCIASVKSKLLPILLDSTVNSPHRLRYNVYQAAVFGALIMGAHACGLSNMYTHSPSFLTNAVLAVIGCIFPHIKALGCNSRLVSVGMAIRISRDEVEWLATHAFLTAMQSAAYQPLRLGRAHNAIEHTICALKTELARLDAGEGDETGASGSKAVGERVVQKERKWLAKIARVAYDSQLRSLRC